MGRPTSSASIRPTCAGATTSRPTPCRSRPRSPSPMTAASSRRTWTWRSRWPTRRASRRAGFGFANPIERAGAPSFEGAEIRFDRAGDATLFSGSVTQGQGHVTVFKQLVCDRLGLDPAETQYLQGDTDLVFFGEGTGGSRSATLAGSAFHVATEKIVAKARAIAAHMLKVAQEDVNFTDGIFSSPKTNQTLTIKEVARQAAQPAKLPKGMEGGLISTAVYNAEMENFPNGCHLPQRGI